MIHFIIQKNNKIFFLTLTFFNIYTSILKYLKRKNNKCLRSFTSFILTMLLSRQRIDFIKKIIHYLFSIQGLCKFLLILTKYFRMTNYMWMFCEGFYLHKLIAAAFAEQKNLIMFYVIGWGK